MKTRQFYISNFTLAMSLVPVLMSLVILISACTFNAPTVDPSKKQTDIARSVESTLNAEKVATYQAQQTLDAGQPAATQPDSPNTNATIQVQQATLDAQSTSLSPQATQPPLPSDTPQLAPTLAPAGSLDPIQILDWKMAFWVSLPNGCRGDAPCWRTNDDYKKHLGLSPMMLSSQQSYLIDPNWPKPYLVFMTKWKITNPATIELIIDGTPMIVKQYPKGQSEWTNDRIDLSNYKGKEISIRFAVNGKWGSGGIQGSEWYLEDVQIIPNYKP
jgi:type II secretory pathway pseudopilin PulG